MNYIKRIDPQLICFLSILFLMNAVAIAQHSEQAGKRNNVVGFVISKNDKTILFASNNRQSHSASIYIMHTDSFKARQLIAGTKELSFFNPSYSPDEKKIIFVGYFNRNVNNSAVFIANADGTGLQQLTPGNEIIKQAFFSIFDSTVILYTKADTYRANSPFATVAAHGMDIYSYNLKSQESKNVTGIISYALYDISEADSTHLMFTIPSGGPRGGMFFFDRKSKGLNKMIPNIDPKISPNIDSLTFANSCHMPRFSKEYNLLGFKTSFELYLMDFETKTIKLVHRHQPMLWVFDDFAFFHNRKEIIFGVSSLDELYSINFNGTELKKIEIEYGK